MIEFLFFDLDNTLLDFDKAEWIAVSKVMTDVGLEPTPERIRRYSAINDGYWKRIELGQIDRSAALVGRFADFFREEGVRADAVRQEAAYESYLGIGHYFMPGAPEILDALVGRYRLFLASNGTANVQDSRLDSSGLRRYFEGIFISERLGANKPSRAFFDACFAQIPDFDPACAMLIGDSLSSDIRGANGAGIKACWLNPKGLPVPPDCRVDREIRCLDDLRTFL